MSAAMDELLETLDLVHLDDNVFRGRSPQVGWQRVFGGQVIGQALIAAQRTVANDRFVHSIHCYFLRPGNPAVPIDYHVDTLRNGMSFTTRRVVAHQNDKPIFAMSASFQIEEDGLEHFMPQPLNVPAPEDLAGEKVLVEKIKDSLPENVKRYWGRERPVELRPVSLKHYMSRDPLPPHQDMWLRTTGDVPDSRVVQAAVLGYLSDMTLLDTALFAHGRSIFDTDLQVASLDHSMWFHRPNKLDDWLLYSQDSPNASGARGFTRGSLYARDGSLVASVTQEGLIRRVEPKK
ncbi:acyl-CoA thioesterase [Ahrensia marina]|uniref:Acyl-CoA thioesterase 2 n=1 Tax=Ahrensia marina TaxID=1514904 RepID=A0A0N0VKY0_9HYPH|nr:acyl-CoA thioesterase II [Ahrensia marina]KPA99993.1 acyl-CoA thioesterase [Ahrensia marina]